MRKKNIRRLFFFFEKSFSLSTLGQLQHFFMQIEKIKLELRDLTVKEENHSKVFLMSML